MFYCSGSQLGLHLSIRWHLQMCIRKSYLVDMNKLEADAVALSGRCLEKAPQKASGGR